MKTERDTYMYVYSLNSKIVKCFLPTNNKQTHSEIPSFIDLDVAYLLMRVEIG